MMKRIRLMVVIIAVLLAGNVSELTTYAAGSMSDTELAYWNNKYKDIYIDGVYYIPEGTKVIKYGEFADWGTDDGPSYWKDKPLKFVIPYSVEKIESDAFSGSNIEEIVIPGTVK